MTEATLALKATPLNAVHRRLGAKMVDFGGWDMPVQYSGILDEHHAVRQAAGLFDVSHMGEIEVTGADALALVDSVTTNAVGKLETGQAQYAGLLYEHGGFVDDILVHKVAGDHYFLCVNASNQEKDYEHIAALNRHNAKVEFASPRYAQLAIQGPKALATLQKLTKTDLAPIAYFRARRPESRAPAIPEKTASKFTLRPARPSGSGTRSSTPARSSGSSPAAWAPGIRCASNRRWRCMVTRFTPRSLLMKPIWVGLSSWTRAASSAGPRSPSRRNKASRASWPVSR
jgi:hypothetical protein